LERHPKVNFIGHAQTWWCNIDRNCVQSEMYPKTRVTPGGLTAGSGLNSMLRDEDHARDFLKRHQDRLLFGSDYNDREGSGPKCLGSQIIAAIRRLAPDRQAERKILYGNAAKLVGTELRPVPGARSAPEAIDFPILQVI
jgi:hypothetical protein